MKTIEITSGNQKALFTTKSMTFHGREFFYANMTDVVNHTDIHTYTFIYDGVSKAFPYEEKDAKVLNAIFSQVQGMQTEKGKPASGGQKPASQPGSVASQKEQDASKPAAMPEKKTAERKAQAEDKAAGQEQAPKPESGKTSEKQAQTPDAAGKKDDETPQTPGETDKKDAGKPSAKGFFAAAKKKKGEKKDTLAEGIDVDPGRQEKLKKSFTVFGIIIAVVIVLSLIYYFVFGTSSDPTPANPNATESQQYNDIDELIDDLQ